MCMFTEIRHVPLHSEKYYGQVNTTEHTNEAHRNLKKKYPKTCESNILFGKAIEKFYDQVNTTEHTNEEKFYDQVNTTEHTNEEKFYDQVNTTEHTNEEKFYDQVNTTEHTNEEKFYDQVNTTEHTNEEKFYDQVNTTEHTNEEKFYDQVNTTEHTNEEKFYDQVNTTEHTNEEKFCDQVNTTEHTNEGEESKTTFTTSIEKIPRTIHTWRFAGNILGVIGGWDAIFGIFRQITFMLKAFSSFKPLQLKKVSIESTLFRFLGYLVDLEGELLYRNIQYLKGLSKEKRRERDLRYYKRVADYYSKL
ncbi:hypothetical protein KSF78_0004579 [Schistosoma japonicum]|nr:hypothetical protein KSF78_0004579 [Schistosoma japonicum]